MRNTLPISGPYLNECGILNLDKAEGPGTHWTAYKKTGKNAIYFDSFGDLRPPTELIQYLQSKGSCSIIYNHQNLQSYNMINCGHLCLKFLYTI
jgi:hypothetical protein